MEKIVLYRSFNNGMFDTPEQCLAYENKKELSTRIRESQVLDASVSEEGIHIILKKGNHKFDLFIENNGDYVNPVWFIEAIKQERVDD